MSEVQHEKTGLCCATALQMYCIQLDKEGAANRLQPSTKACHHHMQERLKALFPGLAMPMEGSSTPTYMQWGLACVRSRAFQLEKERFAHGALPGHSQPCVGTKCRL